MADKINVSLKTTVTIGNNIITFAPSALDVTVSDPSHIDNVQTVGDGAAELLVVGDITTPGMAVFHNKHDTRTVALYLDAGTQKIATLKAGEFHVFRPGSTVIYALAVGGAVDLAYTFLSD